MLKTTEKSLKFGYHDFYMYIVSMNYEIKISDLMRDHFNVHPEVNMRKDQFYYVYEK